MNQQVSNHIIKVREVYDSEGNLVSFEEFYPIETPVEEERELTRIELLKQEQKRRLNELRG